jgi:hypothetical protein
MTQIGKLLTISKPASLQTCINCLGVSRYSKKSPY